MRKAFKLKFLIVGTICALVAISVAISYEFDSESLEGQLSKKETEDLEINTSVPVLEGKALTGLNEVTVRELRSPHSTPNTIRNSQPRFSPILNELVTEQQLQNDIELWSRQAEENGLVRYTASGDRIYLSWDREVKRGGGPMANDFSEDTTLEELVMLSGQDDPAAMLALANTALSAGRWAEGEFYAIQSARTSGSPEPLWHVGLQRQQSSRNPFQDRISASWFLSAYLEGYLGAAIYVEAYFRVMDESDQIWSVARAQEILADLNNQG